MTIPICLAVAACLMLLLLAYVVVMIRADGAGSRAAKRAEVARLTAPLPPEHEGRHRADVTAPGTAAQHLPDDTIDLELVTA